MQALLATFRELATDAGRPRVPHHGRAVRGRHPGADDPQHPDRLVQRLSRVRHGRRRDITAGPWCGRRSPPSRPACRAASTGTGPTHRHSRSGRNPGADRVYDAVVAGAGVAGALIAAELTRAGLRIALVDAGDTTYFDPRSGRDQRDSLVATFFRAPVKTTNSAYPSMEWAPSPDEGALNAYLRPRGPGPIPEHLPEHRRRTTYHWLRTACGTHRRPSPNGPCSVEGPTRPLSYADLESWYRRAEPNWVSPATTTRTWAARAERDHPYPMPPIVATYNDRVVMERDSGLTFEGLPVEFATTPQARNSTLYQGARPAPGRPTASPSARSRPSTTRPCTSSAR